MLAKPLAWSWILVAVFLLAWQDFAPAQGDEEQEVPVKNGRRLLERALEKRGGTKALEVIKDYVVAMTGTTGTRGGGVAKVNATRMVLLGEVPCLRYDAKVRLSETENTVLRITLKGDRGYKQTRVAGEAQSAAWVKKQWAGYHRSSIAVLRGLLDPKVKVEYVGKDAVRNRETEVIRILRPGEPPLDVDVDPTTGYFHRVRWRERPRSGAPPIAHEIQYGGFTSLGRLRGIPTKAEVSMAGKVVMTRTTNSIKVNVGLKAEDFGVE
jgi:hypothetical protein